MKFIKILSATGLMLILFFLPACFEKNNPDPDPDPDPATSLDGYWDNGEIIVKIEGTEGKFYEIRSGEWLKVYQAGFIDIGSHKFFYISPLKADEFFTGQELWHYTYNQVVEKVGWSGNGEFNLRNNGNTLYVNTINPWGTNWSKMEYTRVFP